ncbi:MAG: DUF362 domain-containing protein [Deltaproteobacteria bacterium]|nr:DUF362 domain-containing protein [Deltaproteobacteria bacterium]
MNNKVNRRTFIKNSTGLLTFLSVSSVLPSDLLAVEPPDIAVVEGKDPALQTRKTIEILGGMRRFVRRGDRVVLLPNSEWRYPGAVVNPLIGIEVARLCAEAGAASITLTTNYGIGRWGSGVIKELESTGVRIKSPSHPKDYTTVPVPDFRVRKEVTILREAMEHDVLIDIPVFKNHYGARISGSIKNLMGFNWNSISFHQGETYLQQSIADLASVIRPHLCVVDATTILAENGPGGPGRTLRPNKVIAGTDMVALDAFCCPLLKVNPADVAHIMYLNASGQGQADVSKKRIKEISL